MKKVHLIADSEQQYYEKYMRRKGWIRNNPYSYELKLTPDATIFMDSTGLVLSFNKEIYLNLSTTNLLGRITSAKKHFNTISFFINTWEQNNPQSAIFKH